MGKPWLLWTYDPCPEGGWHLAAEFDTKEEAIKAAEETHKIQDERHRDMVEHCKKEGPRRLWSRKSNCYEKCIVTGGEVFRIGWGEEEEKEEREEIRNLVLEFFKGDQKKTDLWFSSDNPLLGGISPDNMIKVGRIERLADFVCYQLWENEVPKKEGE